MVTVLMAVYNGERYLEEQIQSILQQDEQDFTLWIGDDGSKDKTPQILADFQKEYPDKIRILDYKEATGCAQKNFFRMLQQAQRENCEYVMLSDQDDFWLPDKISRTLAFMKKQEAEAGTDTPILVHTDLKVVNADLKELCESMSSYEGLTVRDKSLRKYLVENDVTGCTLMINKALLAFLEYVPDECAMHDWWLADVAAAFGKVAFLPEATMLYRQHGGNQVGAKKEQRVLPFFRSVAAPEKVRESYRLIYCQAYYLWEQYGKKQLAPGGRKLSPENSRLIYGYVSMGPKNRVGRIFTALRYGFLKDTWAKNLAHLWFI